MSSDRRRYRRLNAPVFVRPAGRLLLPRREVGDIGLGGMRVYSDEPHRPGSRLDMELLLPDGQVLTLTSEVVWLDTLGPEAPARYDVGLRYLDVPPEALQQLRSVLGDP